MVRGDVEYGNNVSFGVCGVDLVAQEDLVQEHLLLLFSETFLFVVVGAIDVALDLLF